MQWRRRSPTIQEVSNIFVWTSLGWFSAQSFPATTNPFQRLISQFTSLVPARSSCVCFINCSFPVNKGRKNLSTLTLPLKNNYLWRLPRRPFLGLVNYYFTSTHRCTCCYYIAFPKFITHQFSSYRDSVSSVLDGYWQKKKKSIIARTHEPTPKSTFQSTLKTQKWTPIVGSCKFKQVKNYFGKKTVIIELLPKYNNWIVQPNHPTYSQLCSTLL